MFLFYTLVNRTLPQYSTVSQTASQIRLLTFRKFQSARQFDRSRRDKKNRNRGKELKGEDENDIAVSLKITRTLDEYTLTLDAHTKLSRDGCCDDPELLAEENSK